MYDREVRWGALVPVAILVGFGALFAEIAGLWPASMPGRPELLWCLAFYSTLRVRPTPSLVAFAFCGLARDLILGQRLGAATMVFVVMGWLSVYWRVLATTRGWLSQALVAGMSGFVAALARHTLDYGPLAYKLLYRIVFVSVADGLLTALAYLPMLAALGMESFRPWRERDGY